MWDHIPIEIQVEITKRLPVKSLIQFRSVSKSWKSLIDSSQFIIAHYSAKHTQLQHLLVSYVDSERKYVSIVDDETFPQQKVSLTVPLSVDMLYYTSIIGTSYGLVCLYGQDVPFDLNYGTKMAVLWNPSIRKAVAIAVAVFNSGDCFIGKTVLGFGVCCETTDPKIVKITYASSFSDMESIEVFTLSTGVWRSPYSNLPRKSIIFDRLQVVIDGFLYWFARNRVTMDGGFRSIYNLIILFDITSEEFREVNLPDSLAKKCHSKLSMSKLRESLVVLENGVDDYNLIFCVWMMEGGVPKLFTKQFTINVNSPDASTSFLRGFRKTGEPVIEMVCHHAGTGSLAFYEPYSKFFINFGISGKRFPFLVSHYMETLLLLDQPDFIIYDKGKSRRLTHTSKCKEPQKTIPQV